MTPRQVIDHYGPTVTAAARALGLSRQTIHRWLSINRVPLAWQYWIAQNTANALKARGERPNRR